MTSTSLLLVGLLLYGLPLALALEPRLRGATLAGAAFLLGAGSAGLHLFVLSVLRIPWTRTSVLLSTIPLLALAIVVARRRIGLDPGPGRVEPPRSYLQGHAAVVDLLTIACVVAYAVFTVWAPPYEWDFYGIWGLKARWFFDSRGMDWSTLPEVGKADYPVLMPLLFDLVAVVTGGWNDRYFGWIYLGLCASMLAIVRGMLGEELKHPALPALAVAFPTLNLWIGLAEAGVMAFGCAGLLFLRRGSIALGAVMLGFAAWSKNEGLALIFVAAGALLVATRSIRKVIRLWPALAIIAPWMITRSVLHLETDFLTGSTTSRVFERLGKPAEVIRAFVDAPPDQPWFWAAVLLTFLFFAREAIRREAFLFLAVVVQLGLMVGQALATTWDFAAHVSLTLNRLPHQVAPAAGFLAVLLLMRVFEKDVPSLARP